MQKIYKFVYTNNVIMKLKRSIKLTRLQAMFSTHSKFTKHSIPILQKMNESKSVLVPSLCYHQILTKEVCVKYMTVLSLTSVLA